ncbi:major facilitator superfamily protein [Artemisia annua]|uniref:Major facilitator superfamily protein n=1 Tax=Artemisia annua TaxID=35608 RepID=A0A2U1PZN4_ARTAN|nr:major facilitator superfamily protein [Artemisia annua]
MVSDPKSLYENEELDASISITGRLLHIYYSNVEFFYDQAPESIRSTATALFWMAIAAGNYDSTLLVTMVHKLSAGQDGSNWLPDDDLNKGKLEYFYWLLTLLQVLNLVYYLFCAKFYTLKPIEIAYKAKDDGDNV